eukprot:UN12115
MYSLGIGTNVNIKLAEKNMNISNEIMYGTDKTNINAETSNLFSFMQQIKVGGQRELDKRWDTMCAYSDKYKEAKLNELEKKLNKRPETYICTVGENVHIMKMCGFKIHGYNEKTMQNIECKNGMVIDFQNLGISYNVDQTFDWNWSVVQPIRVCGGCTKGINGKVFLCRNCEQAYCSKKCQKQDWLSHKQHCDLVRQNATW